MRNMFYQLQAEGRFPQRWNGNSFSATYFNWKKIAEFFDRQQQRFTVDSDDPLEACAAKWDDLIYRLCGPAPEGPSDGPASRPDEGPCATAAEPSGRDTGRSGRVPARPAVYDRLSKFADARTPTDDPSAQLIVNCVRDDGSKAGLRDTCSQVRPVLMAFESDTLTLDEQLDALRPDAERFVAARVFSGRKSYHYQVEVPEAASLRLMELRNKDEELAKRVWHRLYDDVARTLFKNPRALDMRCKSWLRKCRNPGGSRDGVEQTAEFFANEPLEWDKRLDSALFVEESRLKRERSRPKRERTGDASKSDKVVKYLSTPYPATRGNGDSDSSLYSAICACRCAGDDRTLDAVLCKARSERWTEAELTRKVRDAERFAGSRV